MNQGPSARQEQRHSFVGGALDSHTCPCFEIRQCPCCLFSVAPGPAEGWAESWLHRLARSNLPWRIPATSPASGMTPVLYDKDSVSAVLMQARLHSALSHLLLFGRVPIPHVSSRDGCADASCRTWRRRVATTAPTTTQREGMIRRGANETATPGGIEMLLLNEMAIGYERVGVFPETKIQLGFRTKFHRFRASRPSFILDSSDTSTSQYPHR